jgi:hypothetical protein
MKRMKHPDPFHRAGRVLLLAGAALAAVLGGCNNAPATNDSEPEGPPNLLTAAAGSWVPLFDGATLEGWKSAGDENDPTYGAVKVEEGAIVLETGEPMTAVVWDGVFPRDNYEVSVEASRRDGFDFFCGMTFPVGDSYCTLIVGGWGGAIVGLSNVDDFAADNNETTTVKDFENDQWYPIRLRVTAPAIEVWLEDEKVIDLKREERRFSIWPQQDPVRPFGVATWHTESALRNFKFRNLEA